jgi:hypothetical protein
MTAAPAPATPQDRADRAQVFERQIAMLGRLAEVGLEIALSIEEQVKAEPGQMPERACIDYARVSRAVRQTLMLQAELVRQADCAAEVATLKRGFRADERKQQIVRIIDRIAYPPSETPEQAERLIQEARERLDGDEIYGDVLSRPISEIIAAICQDLGLDPDWPDLAQEAWAQAEMASGRPAHHKPKPFPSMGKGWDGVWP